MATVSAFAALQGRRGFILICAWHHSAGPPGTPETGDSFAVRSPQGRPGLTPICVWHYSAGPPRGLTNVATVSQFAAPRDGEASFGIACDTTPPGLPGAHKRGDSLTVRSQGRRGLLLIRVGHHAAGQAKSKRRWPHFRCSQPPGTARLHSDLRTRSLRWTRLQPTKVANISQFAAPQGRQGLILICV